MKRILDFGRRNLRALPIWVAFRAVQQEGLRNFWHRKRITPQILSTPPVATADPLGPASPCEVRILTWQRDYYAALWAAKSFYAFAGVDWPIYWHQGGPLNVTARQQLQEHFPVSQLVTTEEADERVDAALTELGLMQCRTARHRSFMLRKLIDCLILSRSEYILTFDSDLLFFRQPVEILNAVTDRSPVSIYNRDLADCYAISRETAKSRHGVDLVERLNAGLVLICRKAAPLEMIEKYLSDSELFSNIWLTEQTVHALLASQFGAIFFPATYLTSLNAGLTTPDGMPVVAKHYPSHPRPFLYQEGMRHLLVSGLLGS